MTFTVVSSGNAYSCALISSGGGVQCWGYNGRGELGIGTTTAPNDQSTIPLPVCASGIWNGTTCNGGSAFTGVYGVWSGPAADHNCATVIYYILECWGSNSDGQLGSAGSGLNPALVQCAGNSSYCSSGILAGITAVAAGYNHTCALDQGGSVWCWGNNGAGELGDGTTAGRSTAWRVCASGSGQDCPNGTPLSGAAAIAAGDYYSCALTNSGGVKCWGNNGYGQLGDGTTTNRLLPVAVSGLSGGVSAIAAGETDVCAVLSGSAKCWGYNGDGELGDGTQTTRTTPVSVCATGAWDSSTSSCSGGSALSGVSKLSAGSGHTCAVMTSSPYVKCWGSQAFGQLGNSVQSYTSFALNPVSWTVPSWGQPQPTALSAGGLHTCAIISSYTECWGWNAFGQVGDGTVTDTTTWVTQDTDKDGCTDGRELGPIHLFAGQRDPTNFWDFFDTPASNNVRDHKVTQDDYNRVAARYGTSGDPTIDPLSQPPPTGYHPAFDRTSIGPNAWNLGPPNGQITVADMIAVQNQMNDDCTGPP